MKRLLRIGFRVFLALLTLFIIVTTGLYLYISSHKEVLQARIVAQFHKTCNGSLQIKDIRPELLRGFPDATISLDDVVVRDSLWEIHHHDLLRVKHIYVSLRVWSLLSGEVEINKLLFREGAIYLFEDANGYTNRRILRPGPAHASRAEVVIRKFELEDIRLLYQHVNNRKRFDLDIRELRCRITGADNAKKIHSNAEIRINQCIFNELRGSFLKNKVYRGSVVFTYNKQLQQLDFPKQRISLDGHPLMIGAAFSLLPKPGVFRLDISDDRIRFDEARSWLSPNISRHLDSFSFEQPLKVNAHVEGQMKGQPNPFVQISFEVKDNRLRTAKGGFFDHCSFNGDYSNGTGINTVCGDEQSVIRLLQAEASWKGIPIRSDSFNIYNLKQPKIKCRITADFEVKALNNVTGGEVFRFDTGKATLDVRYYGSMNPDDTVSSHIFGGIQIRDAAFTYTPRNISFSHCHVQLELRDQDIIVPMAQCYSRTSQLQMSASARNFLALYRDHPGQILLTASINSSKLNLDEFRSFLGKRTHIRQNLADKVYKSRMAERLDKALDACSTDLSLKIALLQYRKFEATNISAGILILQDGIRFRDVHLQHAGGSISMSGNLEQGNSNNRFLINTSITNVAVDKLFNSFGNFGMQTLHAENIRGTCSLSGTIGGGINTSGMILPGSLQGKMQFVLEHGQLLHFKPLERMGRFVFRKKRLSEVSFSRISNTFTINGNDITIPPMRVASDLLDLSVQGIYSLGSNTDLQIEIPLFSMSKDDINYNDEADGIGPRLRLRGRDDANGELQFSRDRKDKTKKIQMRQERKERKARRRALFGKPGN